MVNVRRLHEGPGVEVETKYFELIHPVLWLQFGTCHLYLIGLLALREPLISYLTKCMIAS
jgi:hypothetical protein